MTDLTDHRPLLGIVGPQKQIPQTLSPRMTRWCIKMSAYDYDLVYCPGSKHHNADALSRLPLSDTIEDPPPVGCVLMFEALPGPPFTADIVARATQDYPTWSRLYKALHEGNVQKLEEDDFNALRKRATELSRHRGCITVGSSSHYMPTSPTSHGSHSRRTQGRSRNEVRPELPVVARNRQ